MSDKPAIMTNPLTNRGTAFTLEQRRELGLIGRLPSAVETLGEQADRAYDQLRSHPTDLARYIFLDQLHNRNEVLYYRLLVDHLQELLPVVYDPTVGEAIKKWSRDYRRSRAIYLSIDRPEDIRVSFESLGLGATDVDLVVCSDAEEILGIGDWGVNGTDISVGKLAVYTAAAGIYPARAIAVNLDCGTDNQQLLDDPAYLGNRHPRIRGGALRRLHRRIPEGGLRTVPAGVAALRGLRAVERPPHPGAVPRHLPDLQRRHARHGRHRHRGRDLGHEGDGNGFR